MAFNSMGTGPRSRAGFSTVKTSGGGAGPTITALLEMGPDFGEGAGNDDTTHRTAVQHRGVEQAAFTGNTSLGLAVNLNHVTLRNDAAIAQAVALPTVGFTGNTALAQRSGAAASDPTRMNYGRTTLHYSKAETGDAFGFINLRQDNASNMHAVTANRTTNAYLTQGATPYTIQPETVPTVSANARVVYAKFPTSILVPSSGTMPFVDGFSLAITATFDNPSLLSDANITCVARASSTNPWTGTSGLTWNALEPITVGTILLTTTQSIPSGGVSETRTFFSTSILTNSLNAKWIYCKFTSDLVGTAITIRHANLSGQPNSYPPSTPPYIVNMPMHLT